MSEKQPCIDIRISAPSLKGIDNTLQVLEANFVLSRKTLPRLYTDKETGVRTFTVYVNVSKWRL